MSEMPANDITAEVARYRKPPNKLRSPQEITARYYQALETYRELSLKPLDSNQLKTGTYTEIKILGWVLGKPEKEIIREIGAHSNSTPFGTF